MKTATQVLEAPASRPKMRYYSFGFDPNIEWPGFAMLGYPWKLAIAVQSGLVDDIDAVEATDVLREIIKQAINDYDPSHRSTHGEDERGEYLLFHPEMVWSGTAERLATPMRLRLMEVEQHFEEEPLPTHHHEDGKCVLDEYGECKLDTFQSENEHRQVLLQEAEQMTDPVRLDALLNLLEEQRILIPLRGEDLDAFLEGVPLLELPSNVTLHSYEVHTNEHQHNGKEEQNHTNERNVRGADGSHLYDSNKTDAGNTGEKGSPVGEGNDFGLLSAAAVESCLMAGLDRNRVRFLGTRSGCADAMNKSTNAANSAKTMMKRPWFEPQFKQWSENQQ